MEHRWFSKIHLSLLVALIFTAGLTAVAQGPAPDAPNVAVQPVQTNFMPQPTFENHRFFDRENRILFIAVAAFNGADFAVTRANLQSGGQELNPIVRPFAHSTATLAANFAAQTAGIVSISYAFHKTGHHKLERFTSYVNIGSSASAVTYGLLHR